MIASDRDGILPWSARHGRLIGVLDRKLLHLVHRAAHHWHEDDHPRPHDENERDSRVRPETRSVFAAIEIEKSFEMLPERNGCHHALSPLRNHCVQQVSPSILMAPSVRNGWKAAILMAAESDRFADGEWRLRHSREPVTTEAGKPLQMVYEQIPADEFLMERPLFF